MASHLGRWLGIVFVAPAVWLLHLAPDHLIAAYVILVVAAVYNRVIQVNLARRPWLFTSGYLTTVGDAGLDLTMILLSGGFGTPLYALMCTGAIASAMRYAVLSGSGCHASPGSRCLAAALRGT